MLQTYSIMPMFPEHADAICADIRRQRDEGIAEIPLFMCKLVPEGIPAVDKASAFMKQYDIFAEKLAAMGISCGVLVQCSLGHGYVLDDDFGFTHYVGVLDGKRDYVVCPYDEDFHAYIRDAMKKIASRHPAAIMIDDDFRLLYRPGNGCYCPRHQAALAEKLGRTLSREALAAALQAGEETITQAYLETQKEALLSAARAIRAGIDEVDPTIPASHCSAGSSTNFSGEIAAVLAGKGNPVTARCNEGMYGTETTHFFGFQSYRSALSAHRLKASGVEVPICEADTCPQNRYATSAAVLHARYTTSLLEGTLGAKHWITRLFDSFEPASGEAYRKKLAAHRGTYEKIAALVPTLRWRGACIPLSRYYDYGYTAKDLWTFPHDAWSACVLDRLGIPLYFSDTPSGAVFLEGEADRGYPDDEVREMLSGHAFISSDAAARLSERGFADLTGVRVAPFSGEHPTFERYADGGCCPVQNGFQTLLPLTPDTVAESGVYHVERMTDEKLLSPGVTRYKNALGGTVRVFSGTPRAPFHYSTGFSFLNETRKAVLVAALKEAGELPVYTAGDTEFYCKAADMADGALFVALFPCGLDGADEVRLCFADAPKAIFRLSGAGEWEPISYRTEGDVTVLPLSLFPLDSLILRVIR